MEKIIQEEIKGFMAKETGLSIIEIPTGRGKTYNILQCIADYREKYPDRKIFFITTQLKNLPYDDLKRIYKNKEQFHNDVMKIERNIANFLTLDLDKFEKDLKTWKDWPEYKELKRSIQNYRQLNETKSYINEFTKIKIDSDLTENERSFRKRIESTLKEETSKIAINIPDKVEDELKYKKLYLIQTKYNWLREIYPTIETDSHKVFMLSMSKFLYGNSTIIEPTYKFINNKITENAIIFIDEFDSTKRVIDDLILENSAKNFENKIDIFKTIHLKFQVKLSKPYMDSCNSKGVKITFDVMKQKANELYEKFFFYDSMQLCKEFRDEHNNFMFHDESLHTLGDPSRSYIIAEKNLETEKLDIKFLTKDEHKMLEANSFIYVNSLLENLEQFFRDFRGFIKRWAKHYSEFAKIAEDKALYSILDKFGLQGEKADLIMENNLYYVPYQLLEKQYKTLSDMIPDATYYNYGFDIHSYVDGPEHNEDTEIKSFQKHDTPEKFMKYLCLKANVIGVSATALVPTFDNYNISYFANILRDKFSLVSEDSLKKIELLEKDVIEEYKKKGIELITKVLGNTSKYSMLNDKQKAIKKLLNYLSEDEADLIARKISSIPDISEYNITRYLDVIQAMYDFLRDENNHAWLFLNWPLLKEDNYEFDERIIRYAFDKIQESLEMSNSDNDNIVTILRSSESFNEEKKKITEDIAAGKRRMVFSSYQTLMAGQNLNFEYNSTFLSNYITIGKPSKKDSRYITADFDGIILGDITHQNYNKSYSEKTIYERNLERIKLATKIQDTYENDYLERWEQERLLKYALRDVREGKDFDVILQKANKCPMSRNKVLQIVMQSVGRITRTYVKNQKIKIYINDKVLGLLDKEELGKHILTPELAALYDICPDTKQEAIDTFTNRAITNSSRANRWINNLMKKEDGEWLENNMNIWKQTRIDILSEPTSDEQNKYSFLYFETDTNANRYFFVQKNDFGTVLIDFKHSRQDFINQNNINNFIAENGCGVQEVSEEDCRLQKLLAYPGMKEFFISKGFATSFESKRFIMTPVVYQNIYKGALGEESGKFILEKWLHIKLKEIDDPTKFELFDFELSKDVYIDFKHWRPYYYSDRKKMFDKISKKLDNCSGKRVYIINIFADGFLNPEEVQDSRIIVIPNLLNEEDSTINLNAINTIHSEDYQGGNK